MTKVSKVEIKAEAQNLIDQLHKHSGVLHDYLTTSDDQVAVELAHRVMAIEPALSRVVAEDSEEREYFKVAFFVAAFEIFLHRNPDLINRLYVDLIKREIEVEQVLESCRHSGSAQ